MSLSKKKIYQLYLALVKKYGKEKDTWAEWCSVKKTKKQRERIVIGAVLTQRTNWKNVEIALDSLEKAGYLNIEKICQLGKRNIKQLENLIRPSGFYKQKAKRLFGLCQFLEKEGGITRFFQRNKDYCREKLLSLYGIGPETADSILLYAGDKLIFVIDEYTKRFVKKHKLADKLSYHFLQELFEKNFPKDVKLYQKFHAIIVLEGKKYGSY